MLTFSTIYSCSLNTNLLKFHSRLRSIITIVQPTEMLQKSFTDRQFRWRNVLSKILMEEMKFLFPFNIELRVLDLKLVQLETVGIGKVLLVRLESWHWRDYRQTEKRAIGECRIRIIFGFVFAFTSFCCVYIIFVVQRFCSLYSLNSG